MKRRGQRRVAKSLRDVYGHRMIMPFFKLSSSSAIKLSNVKRRRFNIIDRVQSIAAAVRQENHEE